MKIRGGNLQKKRVFQSTNFKLKKREEKEEIKQQSQLDLQNKQVFEVKQGKNKYYKVSKYTDYKNESDDENFEEKNMIIDDESFKMIQKLTQNFQLTFTKIAQKKEMKEKPLSDIPIDDVKYIIRKARQTLSYHYGIDFDKDGNKFSQRIALKRIIPGQYRESDEELPLKRQKINNNSLIKNDVLAPFQETGKQLILDFVNQGHEIQNKMILSIANLIKVDDSIMQNIIEREEQLNLEAALKLMEQRNYIELKILFDCLTPYSVIQINFILAKHFPNFQNEGNTLIQTLLPYLNNCENLNFIRKDHKVIAKQFIRTLTLYFLDDKQPLNPGLVKFALKYGIHQLQPVIQDEADEYILSNQLQQYGFEKEEGQQLATIIRKFLILQKKEERENNIKILSKIQIQTNLWAYISELMNKVALRKIFITALLKCQEISHNISELIQVLEEIKTLTTEEIEDILSQNSQLWKKFINAQIESGINNNNVLEEKQLQEFYQEKISHFDNEKIISLDQIIELSYNIQEKCEYYKHNLYQCAISSIILSKQEMYKIVEMPTGSGKTWIQALLAKFYTSKGLKVSIIEPNENLKLQTSELLNDISYDLQVISIDQFYEFPSEDQVIIVNEYDWIIENNSFQAVTSGLTGIWQLGNRKVIFFTATTNTSIEKIIKHIFKNFCVLKFQSEFELVQKVSSSCQGEIKPCKDFEQQMIFLQGDIKRFYEEKPIIIFSDEDKIDQVVNVLKENQWNKFKIGSNLELMREIKSWKNGILVMKPEDGVGVNCKFAIDSIVLITNEIFSESQYLQTQGRSSRARGLCTSIYYPISLLQPQQIIRNLKINHINKIQELERLLKLVWAKRTSKGFAEIIEKIQQESDKLHTLKDLESIVGKTKYSQFVKGIQF